MTIQAVGPFTLHTSFEAAVNLFLLVCYFRMINQPKSLLDAEIYTCDYTFTMYYRHEGGSDCGMFMQLF
jgi:hypothetical protein